jgi:SAM-dependent methyltransferase
MGKTIMTEKEHAEAGMALSKEANVLDGLHRYFVLRQEGIYRTLLLFKLLERRLGDVLEIGPFFGYVPFVLQPNASSYTVLEGDDPAAYPLKPLYEQRGIRATFVDLFEVFGPTHTAQHCFDYPGCSFDTVLCWETMEHFNFNPVRFVRELNRILKPGGKAYITVPNKASFQSLFGLLFGRFENYGIDFYYQYEDYVSNGKRAFYGFHWREYTAPELARLYEKAGFSIESHGTFCMFQNHGKISAGRRIARTASAMLSFVLPRFGPHAYIVAQKSSVMSQKAS